MSSLPLGLLKQLAVLKSRTYFKKKFMEHTPNLSPRNLLSLAYVVLETNFYSLTIWERGKHINTNHGIFSRWPFNMLSITIFVNNRFI